MNNYLLTFIEVYFVDISMDSGTVVVLVAVNVSMVIVFIEFLSNQFIPVIGQHCQ